MKPQHLILSALFLFIVTSCGTAKVVIDPYIGAWSLTTTGTPQGDVKSTMTITKADDNTYAGSVVSDMGSFSLKNLSIVNGQLTSYFEMQDMKFDLTGTFTDNTFNGLVSFPEGEYTTTGTKMVLNNN